MALVIPPPTAIPNSLNPTTAAVERDAEKREITPAVTAENASAATSDSTKNNHEINYSASNKGSQHHTKTNITNEDEATSDNFDHKHSDADEAEDQYEELIISDDLTPEIRILLLIEKKQHILAKSNITDHDRSLISEINYAIRVALMALLRLKELDEIKSLTALQGLPKSIIKEAQDVTATPISLDELFAFTHEDELGVEGITARTRLARAVIGQFYEDNIEPQLQAQIDSEE